MKAGRAADTGERGQVRGGLIATRDQRPLSIDLDRDYYLYNRSHMPLLDSCLFAKPDDPAPGSLSASLLPPRPAYIGSTRMGVAR
jgi:hypothetical protein